MNEKSRSQISLLLLVIILILGSFAAFSGSQNTESYKMENSMIIALILGILVFLVIPGMMRNARIEKRKEFMKENVDGLFCKECGLPTYTEQHLIEHDTRTGEPIYKIERHCPNEENYRFSSARADSHMSSPID